jgi:hypothetical protein
MSLAEYRHRFRLCIVSARTAQKTPTQLLINCCILFSNNSSNMWDLRVFWRWLWRMPSSGMLCRVALVRTDVSEERVASVNKVARIGELGTSSGTSNRSLQRTNVVPSLPILSPRWWMWHFPPKSRFSQEPRNLTSHKTTISKVSLVYSLLSDWFCIPSFILVPIECV